MINVNFKYYVILFVLVMIGTIDVSAHPERTHRYGCHICRTNCVYWGEIHGARHCHNQTLEPTNDAKNNQDKIKGIKVK